MKIIRWIGIVLLVPIVLLGATVVLARFADGPIAIIPGGPLEAGELYSGDEPDWSFARDIMEMEFQLVEPPRSRTIWLAVHDGKLYVVSGYMTTGYGKLWKQWPLEAEADPRALIRIDGKRYERTLVRLHDPAQIEPVAAEIARKYGAPLTADAAASGSAWFYELAPRS